MKNLYTIAVKCDGLYFMPFIFSKNRFLKVLFVLSLLSSTGIIYSQGATCSTASSVTLNGSCLTSGTISDTVMDSGTPSLGCPETVNREGWYSFAVSGLTNVSIIAEITVTNRNLALQLLSSTSSCTGLAEVSCVNSVNSNSAQMESITMALSTGTYYLRVLNVGTSGTMALNSLCISTTPVNNDCSTATALTVNSGTGCTVTTSGTTRGATQSQTGCTGTADDEVWYSFVATQASQTVTITPGTLSDAVFQVFSGSCGNLSSLICRNNTSGSSAETYTLTGLTNGSTYYIRVYSNGNGLNTGTFTACVTTPALAYSAPTSFSPGTLYINNVSFTAANSVSNTSTFTTGYQDFTGITKPTQEQGEVISLSVTGNTSGRIKAWIDWNKDGDFDDTGEQIYDSVSGVTTTSPVISFTVPIATVPGDYRIRVRNHYNDLYLVAAWVGPYFDDFNSSDNFIQNIIVFRDFGEAEDYLFAVTPTCKKSFTGTDGVWQTASNWTPAGVPTASSCITIDNKSVTIPASYVAYGKNINIKNASSLNILSTGNLTITDAVTVSPNSIFLLQDSAGLTQVTDVDNATTNNNSGDISMVRITQPMYRYDFTYWSSPVAGFTPHSISPFTLGDKYFHWDHLTQSWTTDYNGDDIMIAGKGYIVRAPQTYSVNPAVTSSYTAVFSGKPNNGIVNVAVAGSVSGPEKYNLIGNPYPSSIDIEKFLLANNTVVDGTVYLWTHNTPVSNNVYTTSDYATYNFTGSLGTGFGDNAPTEPDAIVNTPTKYVGAGQSFFIKGISNGNSTVVFSNTMRESGNNTQFFRSASGKAQNQAQSVWSGKRVWLNLANNQGAFSQTLVGYMENATNGLDWGYDGELFGGNYVAFYSVNSNKSLAIQGRALPFSSTDELPLGYNSSISGTFTIAIDHLDGFDGQDIFIEDKLQQVIHNVKASAYTFTTSEGTFNDRFVLRYVPAALMDTDNPELNPVSAYKENQKDIVIHAGNEKVRQVRVYDALGKLLYEKETVDAAMVRIDDINAAPQVLIIHILTSNGKIQSKKLLF